MKPAEISAGLQSIIDSKRATQTANAVGSIFNRPQTNAQEVVNAIVPILKQFATANRLTPPEISQIVNGIQLKMPSITIPESKVRVTMPELPPMQVNIPPIEVPKLSPLPDYDSGIVNYPSPKIEQWKFFKNKKPVAEMEIEYEDGEGDKLKSFNIKKL